MAANTEVKKNIGDQSGDREIADRIKALRTEILRVNQKKFGLLVGVKQAIVSQWESATYRPSMQSLQKISSLCPDVNDKIWFIRKAGVEYQELRQAEEKLDELATNKVREQGLTIEQDLLVFAMETADSELKKEGRKLQRPEYAKLVALIYDFCHRTGTRDPDKVESLFETARSAIYLLEPGIRSDRAGQVEDSQKNRSHHGHFGTGKK